MTFTYTDGYLTEIVDSLNRRITFTNGINFTGFNGAARSIRFERDTDPQRYLREDYRAAGPKTNQQLFPDLSNSLYPGQQPFFELTAVVLPDNRRYEFYYNPYGELARVVLPTGGAYEYEWAGGAGTNRNTGVRGTSIYRRVVERREYAQGGSQPTRVQRFERPLGSDNNEGAIVYVDEVDPSDRTTVREHSEHYFRGRPSVTLSSEPDPLFSPAGSVDGREYRTDVFTVSGAARTLLRKVEYDWQPRIVRQGGPEDPRLVSTTTTLADTNQVAKQIFGYDQYNNRTDVYEYDYGPGAPGSLKRHTHTDYVTSGYDTQAGPHIRNLPKEIVAHDGAGAIVARSEMRYDEGLLTPYDPAPAGWSNPGTTARGNPTSTTSYADAANSAGPVTTRAAYDIVGNAVSSTDAHNQTTTLAYSSAYQYAYPTLTTSPIPDPSNIYASNTALTTSTSYDYSTGLVTAQSDANGQTTSFAYYDDLDRLTRVSRPDGEWTEHYYDRHDNAGVINEYVRTRTALDSGGRYTESYQFFDGLGRPNRHFPSHEPGRGWQTVDTQYDALGQVRRVSNPYYTPGGAPDPVNPQGLWTTTDYDALGRVRTVTTPDGATVTTSYSGNSVTVTDQAGKSRRSTTDALGRLTSVVEAPDALGYETAYTYDALGNLRKVAQGDQQRFFLYDSLSRLLRARNPEQDVNAGLGPRPTPSPATRSGQWPTTTTARATSGGAWTRAAS